MIKITDFNHVIENEKLIECNWKGNCGTPWFKAPELLLELPYDYGVDIWGLGCIFNYLLTGKFIFNFNTHKLDEKTKNRINLKVIFERLGLPNSQDWPEILN